MASSCIRLPLWGSWRGSAGEGKPGTMEPPHSDRHFLCQRDIITTAVFLAACLPSPSSQTMTLPGLRHSASAALRLRFAGRCPNSSSLLPPLAAVVAVAPKGRGIRTRQTFPKTTPAPASRRTGRQLRPPCRSPRRRGSTSPARRGRLWPVPSGRRPVPKALLPPAR